LAVFAAPFLMPRPRALSVQTAAREADPQLLMPPAGVKFRKGGTFAHPSDERFAAWLAQFEHPNAAVAAIDELRAGLTFAPDHPHERFEAALRELGEILGFESRRPEREVNDGPDVLWIDGQFAVPMEAKNRMKQTTDAISKHAAGQLMQAEAWTKKTYSEKGKIIPVSVHLTNRVGK
jgi:hypothetical protein